MSACQAELNKKINASQSYGRLLEYPPLPQYCYDILYADLPWDYRGKMQYSRLPTDNDKTAIATSAA